MKKKRYTEAQIIGAIKQPESGVKFDDICRQLTTSNSDKKIGSVEFMIKNTPKQSIDPIAVLIANFSSITSREIH